MNCKQGDLAVIVSASVGMEWVIGHFCRVIQPITHPSGVGAGWVFEPPVCRGREWFDATLDCRLQPIRGAKPAAVEDTGHRISLPEAETA